MSQKPKLDLGALLEALLSAEIELIVVGGAAAVLHGAPVTTQDLDVVYRRSRENLDRLEALLERIDATVRDPAGRRLRPNRSHLEAGGMLRLDTDHGPFDPMATLGDGRGYEELRPHSEVWRFGDREVRVLDLPTLVEVKAEAGRAKDRAVLPILLALLRERESDEG